MSPDAHATITPEPMPETEGPVGLRDSSTGSTGGGDGERPPRNRPRRWALGLALLLVASVGVLAWTARTPDVRDGTEAVDAAGMAAAHGIDVDLVAVTAAGGLVELRMQVTDPDKADDVMHGDVANLPVLVDEATGQTLQMSAPPHHRDELRLGGQYFFLLANTRNALHPGSEVTLVIGDTRLEHLQVQG